MMMLNKRLKNWKTAATGVVAGAMSIAVALLFAYPTDGSVEASTDIPDNEKLVKLAPGKGYLESHAGVRQPKALFGGPLKVTVKQDAGGVFVALPDERELDVNAFGTPEYERAFAGTPGINGLPPQMRAVEGDRYTKMKAKSPFGDAHIVLPDGKLNLEATDVTATDAATTEDQVRFEASWKDKAGNTYTVKCCEMLAAHGLEYPTFGGVVTNHLLHGFTRIGTALMPTEFAYVAFWGMGAVIKNGEVMQKPRLVHGMLTEYVRTEGYELGHDEDVTPTRLHFHLMVPPMMPSPEEGRFKHNAVQTGFELPNGMQLPFWHVMFENLEINSSRVGA